MSRMPEVGDVVDDVFRVEAELDHGNFGSIYRVHDIVEDRTLALKIQKPGPHDEDEVRQRFEREARLIYSLDHDHVVEVLYYGQTDDGLPYMAMEFLDGTDLKRLLRGGFELNDDQIKRITMETLSALEAAHRVGIVHRDLKPANVFLVDDGDRGHVKVLDFGFAKAIDDQNKRQITRAGTLVGSPAYMAPELVHKKNVGAHSDLYGVGLILAEMISGEKAVQIENVYDTIVFQGSDEPVELSSAVERSPFAKVVRKAVRKDVAQRYQTAGEMMDDLEKIDRGGESADLQHHAEVNTETSAPFVVGNADQEAETEPQASGLPSMAEVERTLQNDSNSSAASNPSNPSGPGNGHAGRNRRQSPHQPAAQSGENLDSGTGRTSTGPVQPADASGNAPAQRRSTGPLEEVDPGGPTGRNLDMNRPTSSHEPSRGPSSLVAEILLGVLLGSLGLVVILFVLFYLR